MWRTGSHEQLCGDSGCDEPAGEGDVLLHEEIEVSHGDKSRWQTGEVDDAGGRRSLRNGMAAGW